MFHPRISLKWFLLGTTFVGIFAGTYGKRIYEDWLHGRWLKRQAAISKELTSAGCEVKMANGRVSEVIVPVTVKPGRVMPQVAEASELEQLTVYCPLRDEDVALLGLHRRLRLLRIGGAETTNRALGVIGGMAKLEDLTLYNSRLNDDGLKELSGLAELNHICVTNCPTFTGKGLAHLKILSKLRWVELWQVHLREGQGLAMLDHVDTLEIRQSRVESGVLTHVGKMKSLKSLGFVQSTLLDESLAGLKESHQLERIAFSSASVSDKGMVHLYELKQLQQITVARSKVTPQGARELREHLPNTAITE